MENATLLLVEDDALLQCILAAELKEAGFTIVAMSNGTDALTELSKEKGNFKAVVTDVNLGAGPDGWVIGRQARKVVADMPVVYMSGAGNHEWSSKGVPESVMIAKPFVPGQLTTAISTLIGRR
jgi:DNA-binding response OmpR family regulator